MVVSVTFTNGNLTSSSHKSNNFAAYLTGLGLLSINALCAANWVFIPVQAEYYALEGFSMLMNSVKMIQKRINRNLKIFGVAMTMVDQRSKLSLHVCNEVQSKIPRKVFKTPIRRLAKVAEAAWTGAPTVILNRPSKSGAGAGSRAHLVDGDRLLEALPRGARLLVALGAGEVDDVEFGRERRPLTRRAVGVDLQLENRVRAGALVVVQSAPDVFVLVASLQELLGALPIRSEFVPRLVLTELQSSSSLQLESVEMNPLNSNIHQKNQQHLSVEMPQRLTA